MPARWLWPLSLSASTPSSFSISIGKSSQLLVPVIATSASKQRACRGGGTLNVFSRAKRANRRDSANHCASCTASENVRALSRRPTNRPTAPPTSEHTANRSQRFLFRVRSAVYTDVPQASPPPQSASVCGDTKAQAQSQFHKPNNQIKVNATRSRKSGQVRRPCLSVCLYKRATLLARLSNLTAVKAPFEFINEFISRTQPARVFALILSAFCRRHHSLFTPTAIHAAV